LEGHDQRADRIPEQRKGEDRPATETVGEVAEDDGAEEQSGELRGDEAREASHAEQRLGRRRKDAAFEQAERDISGQEEVVEFGEAAERQQNNEIANIARLGQTIEPRRDGYRSTTHDWAFLNFFPCWIDSKYPIGELVVLQLWN
jgi:hypothetical protein